MSLEKVLRLTGIDFEKTELPDHYSDDPAAADDPPGHCRLAKPVIVKTAGQFAMCVLPEDACLNLERVSDALNAPDVALASESELQELYAGSSDAGAAPPVGVMFGVRTIMEDRLQNSEFLLIPNRGHTHAVKVRRRDWEQLCGPLVASIADRPARAPQLAASQAAC